MSHFALWPRLDLASASCWDVTGIHDVAGFFRALVHLMPPGSTVYLEGGAHPVSFRKFLLESQCEPATEVPSSTVWPQPFCVHLPATAALLASLAKCTEHMAEPEVCDHLHGYAGNEVVFAWFDAFFDPLMVSKSVPELSIARFCAELGASYVRA